MGLRRNLCDFTDTAQASRGDLSVAARGLYDFFRAYNQFWAPKYHLKSYIIRLISVLYLCGTNVQMYPYGNHAMGQTTCLGFSLIFDI